MAKKTGIEFEGFDILSKRLKELDGDIRETTESALKATHNVVYKKVVDAIRPHKETGETADAVITTPVVEWTGDTASVAVGFDIANGGLASIFLMYGTKIHGQPHIAPDKNLYNAVYGSKTKKEIAEIQQKVFLEAIERVVK